MVSIPVFVGGALDGVLNIYSAEAGVFDATATALLSTLCKQIGVGMENFRATSRINDALEGDDPGPYACSGGARSLHGRPSGRRRGTGRACATG